MMKKSILLLGFTLGIAILGGCSGGKEAPKEATGETKTAEQAQRDTGRGKVRQESQEGVSRG